MIEKLLARFGYVPKHLVDQAKYEGRVDGQHEVQERCESIVETTKAQCAGIERERDHLRKLIAEQVALQN